MGFLPMRSQTASRTRLFKRRLGIFSPYFFVVVAYGADLAQVSLGYSEAWRHQCSRVSSTQVSGAAPIVGALQGERTGITTMMMDAGMDTGHLASVLDSI